MCDVPTNSVGKAGVIKINRWRARVFLFATLIACKWECIHFARAKFLQKFAF